MTSIPKYNIKKTPLVSIIMPTYNRAFIIEKAVKSVLCQTYKNIELIIVDDGSTDNTEEILRQKFSRQWGSKIKYIKTEKSGVSSARNTGLENSNGEYIAYLDTDNLWRCEFLVTMIHLLQTSFSKCAYCGLKIENEVNQMVFTLFKFPFNWDNLYQKNYIDLNGFVHHKSLYDELGGFDQEMKRLVDWDLILRYTNQYEPLPVPYILVDYQVSKSVEHITTSESYSTNRYLIEKKF